MYTPKRKKFTALVCARGGSKGLPGKNIKKLSGKPLIGHSIEIAKKSKYIDDILVSTDSIEISEIARKFGASIPYLREQKLAQDDTPEWVVWQDIVRFLIREEYETEGLVVLPPTAPLRILEDIDGAIEIFLDNPCDGVVCATDAHRNPYFNMVTLDPEGCCKIAVEHKEQFFRRQDTPNFYDLTTVCYVMSLKYILDNSYLFKGKILMKYVPPERSIDIDTQFDFDLAEFLYMRK